MRVCDFDHGAGEVGADEKRDRSDSAESCRAIGLTGLHGVGDQFARDDLGIVEKLAREVPVEKRAGYIVAGMGN